LRRGRGRGNLEASQTQRTATSLVWQAITCLDRMMRPFPTKKYFRRLSV
jgi:hypothetical protein